MAVFGPHTRILCVGLNYRDHAAEGGFDIPTSPTIFLRYPSSFVHDGEALVVPKVSDKFDYEGELVIVIGKGGRAIPVENALNHVEGYTIGMDGSVRDFQRRTTQFTLGKIFDKSGALGPRVVPASDVVAGAKGLSVQTRVNGQLLQDGNTNDMIFGVPEIIAAISEVMTLEPGDLILTGTPAGVGFARKPAIWLKAGDTVEVSIEGLGSLKNSVIAEA